MNECEMLKAACNKDVQLSFLHHGPCAQTPENAAMLGNYNTISTLHFWQADNIFHARAVRAPLDHLSEVKGISFINHFFLSCTTSSDINSNPCERNY